MFDVPNARQKRDERGEVVEYVDPLADLGELLFSKTGAALIVGADVLFNGSELLGTGLETIGEIGGEIR